MQLDETDRAIIAALVADARSSFAEIGQSVALSAPAVKRRVDRLRAAGVIKGFTAVVDPDGGAEAFVELYCRDRTTPAEIAALARRYSVVVSAFTVAGRADALLHLRGPDIAALEQAIEQLRTEAFVTSTRSMIVLSRLMPG